MDSVIGNALGVVHCETLCAAKYVEWGALHKQGYLKSQRRIWHGSFYVHRVLLMGEYVDSVTFVRHGSHPQFQLDLIVVFDANELVKQISLYGSTQFCLSKANFQR
jgi:hypothetical protein